METQETVDKNIGIVETILSERKKTHGNFRDHARCTQRLKAVLRDELEIMGKTLTMEQWNNRKLWIWSFIKSEEWLLAMQILLIIGMTPQGIPR